MNKSDNKITVIIPNYNNQKLLANLLESLKQVTLPHDIIIVDNDCKYINSITGMNDKVRPSNNDFLLFQL